MKPSWYWQRLRRMSAAELLARTQVELRKRRWRRPDRRRAMPARTKADLVGGRPAARLALGSAPPGLSASDAAQSLIAAADALLAGQMTVFGLHRADVGAEPDWFLDPLTGRRSDPTQYCFDVPYRDETSVGNVKYLWEASRHQAATQLAAAWWLTRRTEYAERVGSHLRSWWRDNPFLQGVHWVSGIEVGLRLLSWTWIRALLADWEGCHALFDGNPAFRTQLCDHQRYIAAFHSHGSSANNHLIAELAGLATAAVAFPWFAESARWARWSRDRLAREAARQTGADGFNREQALDYHLFAFEMLLAAGLAARVAGARLPDSVDSVLRDMADAMAASLDGAGFPPRYGDGDDGRGLLLDAEPADRAAHVGCLLGAAAAVVGQADWWPEASVRQSVLGAVARLAVGQVPPARRAPRPHLFPDTGQAILRAYAGPAEIWVRCDHGRLGYLSIAAHGHADALSVELRHGGTEVLTDPGTYCYHGEPEWRSYFKGTPGHNTLVVDGVDQSVNGGPFLWLTQPASTLEEYRRGDDKTPSVWQARHDGYRRLRDQATHHRRVTLDPLLRVVHIDDWIAAAQPHAVLLSLHLGPTLQVDLAGATALLSWSVAGVPGATATIALPEQLAWSLHRGETSPPRGWYSCGFGRRTPAPTLAGQGTLAPGTSLHTTIALPAGPTLYPTGGGA